MFRRGSACLLVVSLLQELSASVRIGADDSPALLTADAVLADYSATASKLMDNAIADAASGPAPCPPSPCQNTAVPTPPPADAGSLDPKLIEEDAKKLGLATKSGEPPPDKEGVIPPCDKEAGLRMLKKEEAFFKFLDAKKGKEEEQKIIEATEAAKREAAKDRAEAEAITAKMDKDSAAAKLKADERMRMKEIQDMADMEKAKEDAAKAGRNEARLEAEGLKAAADKHNDEDAKAMTDAANEAKKAGADEGKAEGAKAANERKVADAKKASALAAAKAAGQAEGAQEAVYEIEEKIKETVTERDTVNQVLGDNSTSNNVTDAIKKAAARP